MAGTHFKSEMVKRTERYTGLSMDWKQLLDKAIDNLHKCLWIGILEHRDRSMELLQYQTGLGLQYADAHIGYREYTVPSRSVMDKIKRLMPVDRFLYEYAKQLFEHRWQWYVANVKGKKRDHPVKKEPVFPEVIDGCVSSPNYLKCPGEKEWTDKV